MSRQEATLNTNFVLRQKETWKVLPFHFHPAVLLLLLFDAASSQRGWLESEPFPLSLTPAKPSPFSLLSSLLLLGAGERGHDEEASTGIKSLVQRSAESM